MHTKLNISQISVLEEALANHRYLNKATLTQLTRQTGLPERIIRRWFVQRRFQVPPAKMERALFISEYIQCVKLQQL